VTGVHGFQSQIGPAGLILLERPSICSGRSHARIRDPSPPSAALSLAVAGTFAQDSPAITEVSALLREAGKLVPEIEEVQQSSAASNIAGQQVLAGDLAGALETVHSVKRPQDSTESSGLDYYGIAWNLGKVRSWRVGMDLVRGLKDDNLKALDYLGLAESLAANGDFEHALTAARAIRRISKADSRFADTLVDVSNQQFKAGDTASATATLDEALDAIERERSDAGTGFSTAQWYAGTIQRLVSAGTTGRLPLSWSGCPMQWRKKRIHTARRSCSGTLRLRRRVPAISRLHFVRPGDWATTSNTLPLW